MKTLKKLIEDYGFQGPKHNQGTRKPGEVGPFKKFIGNTPVSKTGKAPAPTEASQEFVDDHEINVVKDANGNDDKLFKASNIKPVERKKEKHGYNAKEAEDVNEKRLTMKELKKREEVAKAIERENPGIDMSKKMAIATATAKRVAEALDHNVKAKENVEFHHGQAMDYAKEITNMLGDYKKHLKGEKNVGEFHAMDMAGVHGGLKQVHDNLKYAVMGIKPMPKATTMNESIEEQQEVPQFDSILEAVHYHQQQEQEEAELIDAYSSVLESVYDGLDDEAAKQEFLQMLESDEAFDQLMSLVEERLGEE